MTGYVFDIDGTIADISHRLHFIKEKPQDWKAFFAACSDDAPIESTIDLIHALCRYDRRIIFVSGRSEECRAKTVAWLNRYIHEPGALFMRTEGDHRQDNIIKGELLDRIIATYPDLEIAGVFEDRDQVVEMYRARGLKVYQVAKGDF